MAEGAASGKGIFGKHHVSKGEAGRQGSKASAGSIRSSVGHSDRQPSQTSGEDAGRQGSKTSAGSKGSGGSGKGAGRTVSTMGAAQRARIAMMKEEREEELDPDDKKKKKKGKQKDDKTKKKKKKDGEEREATKDTILTAQTPPGGNESDEYQSWKDRPRVPLRQRCKACCRAICTWLRAGCRYRLKQACNMAKEALKKEMSEGINKTATAKQLAKIRKRGVDNTKEDLKKSIMKTASRVANGGVKTQEGGSERRAEEQQRKQAEIVNPGGFGAWSFIIHNPGVVSDYFDMKEEIGSGGSAKVYKAKERSTKVIRAIKKIFKREPSEMYRLFLEVSIMKQLDHPNVVKLFETFEDEKAMYLVLELCEGGDLLDRLVDHGKFAEYQAAVTIRIVFMLLNYYSTHGFCHRDIKLENMLFKDSRPDVTPANLRMVDFGYAYQLDKSKPPSETLMTTKVGSPFYMAPEVIAGEYNETCDIWSAGVCLYMLLSGTPPFGGANDAATLEAIKKGEWIFPRSSWMTISKPAKHLIKCCLNIDPKKRITLKQALEHQWVKNRGVARVERMREETVDRLINFHHNHKLRQASLLAIAYQLESRDVRQLQELFLSLDTNGDGILTRQEFSTGVQACGIEETFIAEMMQSVDADNSGVIDYSEFLAATLERTMYIKNHGALMRAFRCFDQDDGGSLDIDEIAETLDMQGKDEREEVEGFFQQVDMNGDGAMDYGEFHNMMKAEYSTLDQMMAVAGKDGDNEEDKEEDEEDGDKDEDAGKQEKSDGEVFSESARGPKSLKGTDSARSSARQDEDAEDLRVDIHEMKSARKHAVDKDEPDLEAARRDTEDEEVEEDVDDNISSESGGSQGSKVEKRVEPEHDEGSGSDAG